MHTGHADFFITHNTLNMAAPDQNFLLSVHKFLSTVSGSIVTTFAKQTVITDKSDSSEVDIQDVYNEWKLSPGIKTKAEFISRHST